jgi:hypothetical protein
MREVFGSNFGTISRGYKYTDLPLYVTFARQQTASVVFVFKMCVEIKQVLRLCLRDAKRFLLGRSRRHVCLGGEMTSDSHTA